MYYIVADNFRRIGNQVFADGELMYERNRTSPKPFQIVINQSAVDVEGDYETVSLLHSIDFPYSFYNTIKARVDAAVVDFTSTSFITINISGK